MSKLPVDWVKFLTFELYSHVFEGPPLLNLLYHVNWHLVLVLCTDSSFRTLFYVVIVLNVYLLSGKTRKVKFVKFFPPRSFQRRGHLEFLEKLEHFSGRKRTWKDFRILRTTLN